MIGQYITHMYSNVYNKKQMQSFNLEKPLAVIFGSVTVLVS